MDKLVVGHGNSMRNNTIAGFALVALGVMSMLAPFAVRFDISATIGVLMILGGIILTLFYLTSRAYHHSVSQFLVCTLLMLSGLVLVAVPTSRSNLIADFLMLYFLLDCVASVFCGLRLRPATNWGWFIFGGLTSLVLAIMLYNTAPKMVLFATGFLIGVRLIIAGWTVVVICYTRDSHFDHWDLYRTE